jgi:hypothetical protein
LDLFPTCDPETFLNLSRRDSRLAFGDALGHRRNPPRLGYATFADALLITCYFVAARPPIDSILVQRLEARDRAVAGERIDRTARWMLPVIAVTFLVVSALMLWN